MVVSLTFCTLFFIQTCEESICAYLSYVQSNNAHMKPWKHFHLNFLPGFSHSVNMGFKDSKNWSLKSWAS